MKTRLPPVRAVAGGMKADGAPLRVGTAIIGAGLLFHADGADSLVSVRRETPVPPPVPQTKVRAPLPLPGFGQPGAAHQQSGHHALAMPDFDRHEGLAAAIVGEVAQGLTHSRGTGHGDRADLATVPGGMGVKSRLLASSAESGLDFDHAVGRTTVPAVPQDRRGLVKASPAARPGAGLSPQSATTATGPATAPAISSASPATQRLAGVGLLDHAAETGLRGIATGESARVTQAGDALARPAFGSAPRQPENSVVTAPLPTSTSANADATAAPHPAASLLSGPSSARLVVASVRRAIAGTPGVGPALRVEVPLTGMTVPVAPSASSSPVRPPSSVPPVTMPAAPPAAELAPMHVAAQSVTARPSGLVVDHRIEQAIAALPVSEYTAMLSPTVRAGRGVGVKSTAISAWDVAGPMFRGYPPEVISPVEEALAALRGHASQGPAMAPAAPPVGASGRKVAPASPAASPVVADFVGGGPAAPGKARTAAKAVSPIKPVAVNDAAKAPRHEARRAVDAGAKPVLAARHHAPVQDDAHRATVRHAASAPAAARRFAMRSLPEPAFGRADAGAGIGAVSHPSGSGGDPEPERSGAGLPASPIASHSRASDPSLQPAVAQATRPRAVLSPGAPLFGYDDELVLELHTAKGNSSDTVIAYGTRGGVYLPLGAMARFLDLAIRISDDGHFASGWFLDEKRTISVDLRQGRIVARGKERAIAPGDAAAFDGELYLRSDLYGAILPLTIKPNLRDQSVEVTTLEPFPFEERLSREAERERLASLHNMSAPQRWPRDRTPWSLASVPTAEAEMRVVSDSQLGSRYEEDLRLAGDLAFMTAQAYASVSSRDGLTAARLQLGRRDPDGRLLGPLRATEFQLGDVSSPQLALGLRGISGRGAFVTNAPIEAASVFDSLDLRGPLPDGYEVELYRNGLLVASTRKPVNGQYEFLAVPVEYGLNILRLVFYGPQGQRHEEVRRLSVGDGRLAPGQVVYAVAAAQKDVNLFRAHGPNFTPGQDYGTWRSTAQMAWGINRAVTVIGSAAWFDSDLGRNWLATTGLRTGLFGLAARADLGFERGGARALDLGVGGRVFGLSFTVDHAEYRGGFIDETRALSSDPLRSATAVEVSGSLSLGKGARPFVLPLAARYAELEHLDGRRDRSGSLRTSFMAGRLLLSHALDYTATSAPGMPSSSQLVASFDLASLSGSRTQFRGGGSYRVFPSPRLQSVGFEVDHRIDDRTTVGTTINHAFDGRQTSFGLSAVRRFQRFTLGFDGNIAVPGRQYGAMLRLGLSFGRNPLDGRLFMAPPGLATSGATVVQAFRDTNGNGRFDAGEAPLAGATFTSGAQTAITDKRGQAFLGPLGSGTRTSVQLDVDTLPDIALAPATRGIEVVPRPGRIHVAQFAIDELSEVEGVARFESSARRREVSGLQLQLLDAKGDVVARARSEADGFFLFEQLRPGHYRIRVDPDQVRRFGLTLGEDIAIDIGPKASTLHRDVAVRNATGKGT